MEKQKIKLIVTIDTEADNQWHEGDLSLNNIKHLPRFQALCEKYGMKPTYLLSHEVAASNLVDDLKDWQDKNLAEIGAHLHPWTTPPYEENHDYKIHSYPHELDDNQLLIKLKNLTDIISQKFNKLPVSFRAGRWGFDERVAKHLKSLGYKVDCSVTPKINWQKTIGDPQKNGGPDFRFHSVYPHTFEGITEIPMTILFTGIFKKENTRLAKLFLSLPESFIKKVLNKLFFRQRWLRIFDSSSAKDWKLIYKSAVKNNLPVMEFMIHSSELMVGGSPYSKTEQQLENIYTQLEEMFKYFKSKNTKNCFLKDLIK